jgi:hypothetical protein
MTTSDLSPTTKLQNFKTLALSFAPTVTAAGTTQATATPITASVNLVAAGAAGSGVILPALSHGTKMEVINATGAAVNVWPPVGWSIYGGGANTARSLTTQYRLAVIANPGGSQWMIESSGPLIVP